MSAQQNQTRNKDDENEFFGRFIIPERNLWARVLEQAMREALRGEKSALRWFQSQSEKRRTFIWVCDILSFDPLPIRKIILSGDKEFLKLL